MPWEDYQKPPRTWPWVLVCLGLIAVGYLVANR